MHKICIFFWWYTCSGNFISIIIIAVAVIIIFFPVYYRAGTDPFDMAASVTSPSGVTELCDVVSLNDNRYSIKFVPKEMGVHTVSVKHKDMHIPGNPHLTLH